MTTTLKGAFHINNRLYEMWVEPASPLMTHIIRNDFDSCLPIKQPMVLAQGNEVTVLNIYTAWKQTMQKQTQSDGCTATIVPSLESDI